MIKKILWLNYFYKYRDLFSNEDTKKIALETYEKNKDSYMRVANRRLEKILKLESTSVGSPRSVLWWR